MKHVSWYSLLLLKRLQILLTIIFTHRFYTRIFSFMYIDYFENLGENNPFSRKGNSAFVVEPKSRFSDQMRKSIRTCQSKIWSWYIKIPVNLGKPIFHLLSPDVWVIKIKDELSVTEQNNFKRQLCFPIYIVTVIMNIFLVT